MLGPLAVTDLVPYQGVACGCIGNAQQGFGQAHEGHPFLGGQGVFLQQALHQAFTPRGGGLIAQGLRQLLGQGLSGCLLLRRQARGSHQTRQQFGFRGSPQGGDGGAQRRALNGPVDKIGEGGLGLGKEL